MCFLPLFMGMQSHLEDNDLRKSLEDTEWDVYAASSLTLTAPLIVETCFDLFSKYKENSSKKRKTLEEAQRESEIQDTKRKSGGGGGIATFTDAEKIVYLMGMIVSPATAFLPNSTKNMALVYLCARMGQLCCVFGAVIASFQRMDSCVWTSFASNKYDRYFTFVVLLLCVVGNVVAVFKENQTGQSAGNAIHLVFVCLPLLATLLTCIRWLLGQLVAGGSASFSERSLFQLAWGRLRRVQDEQKTTAVAAAAPAEAGGGAAAAGGGAPTEGREAAPTGQNADKTKDNKDDKNDAKKDDTKAVKAEVKKWDSVSTYQAFYVATIAVLTVMVISARLHLLDHPEGLGTTGSDDLINALIPYIVFQFMSAVIHMRFVKFEAVQTLIDLLEAKKQYLRYISHEVRTPLNAAFLGLRFLRDEMRDDTSARDRDRYDTVKDIQSSCLTAIDILNDLLCFDKLESGILDLHKTDEKVVPFLTACLGMFSAQAKECGVRLTLQLSPSGNSTSAHVQNTPTPGTVGAAVVSAAPGEDRPSFRRRTMFAQFGRKAATIEGVEAGDTVLMDKFKVDQVLRNLVR